MKYVGGNLLYDDHTLGGTAHSTKGILGYNLELSRLVGDPLQGHQNFTKSIKIDVIILTLNLLPNFYEK